MYWYERTVYPWRTVGSTVWLLLILLPISLLYHILTVLDVQRLLYTSVLYTSITLLHVTQSWLTTVGRPVFKFRYQKVFKMFKLSHVLYMLLCVAMATIQSHCMIHYDVILHKGLLYGVRFIKNEQFILQFALIQQGKLFEFKKSIHHIVEDSFVLAAKDVMTCLSVHFIINMWTMNIISLTLSLINIRLLWLLFVNVLFMEFSFNLSIKLHHIFQRQSIQFPVTAMFTEDTQRTLSLALQSNNTLANYLGYMDLANLSMQSPTRRAQIYGLSSDGRPLAWDSICQQCMNKLNTIIDNNEMELIPVSTTLYEVNKPRVIKRGWGDETQTLTRRNVNYERASLSVQEVPAYKTTPTVQHQEKGKSETSIAKLFTNYIKSLSVVSYLLEELPDAKTNEIYNHSLLYIWIITGLSHLCAYSYSEDQYGVVQKSLSNILKTLLKIHCLKHPSSVNSLEQMAVKNAVEQSLQLLAFTFNNDTKLLELSSDEKWTQLINSF